MKIIVHTKYGVFEGVESEYREQKYLQTGQLLEKISKLEYFCFNTDKGEIYMTKEMIADSLFILEK
jgi:hypothetical protein